MATIVIISTKHMYTYNTCINDSVQLILALIFKTARLNIF